MTRDKAATSGVSSLLLTPPQKFPSAKIRWKSSRLPRFFLDQGGILVIDYLPKSHTMIAEYYSSLPVQLKDILKEKRRGKFTKLALFLHENAPAHRALATLKKLSYLGFQYLDHPPNSPYLAPSDYHLFPGQKKKQLNFAIFRPVICFRGDHVGRTNFWFYLSGLQKLEQRAKKCIDFRGEDVEITPNLVAVACFLPGRANYFSATPCFNISTSSPLQLL